ncbi:helix-turn-helix domain-containing protein [Actinomycetospora endophytica]|uniref:Helix-turn-helix domain-containing protein n=1 Tax=Actinomycetospora endophytica TaxID=2291215 RepID=A0ABS8PB09_9PSEU|nr:helix-turn-helix domain-containing protein [Actinomycetospora endophytica]MCD2194705.1 helix-turn-helix domain-containing protein [Actinomycetospora endophytica]
MSTPPTAAPPGFGDLLELLETVSDRVDTLDVLAGEGEAAQENRTIFRSRARLAREQAQQIRSDVGEVRRQARALARAADSLRDESSHLAPTAPSTPLADLGVFTAARAAAGAPRSSGAETTRAQRLVEDARHVSPSVRWTQLSVPTSGGVVTWSSGRLPSDAVAAIETGPRALVLAGADLVAVDGEDPRWPALTIACGSVGVDSVLALRLGRGTTPGALVFAAGGSALLDPDTREVVRRLAEHVTSAVLDDGRSRTSVDFRARAVVDGACAVLGRYLAIEPEETFEALLETARAAGVPVLDVAERLLAALVPRAPVEDAAGDEPAALRRAVAYVDGHAIEDVGLDDIAAAAGVGPRSLQLMFRRHLDVTPLQYLRGVRLDRAHAELGAARPGAGVTVGAVAARWHFAHAGRFSTIYRDRFGVSPGSTLRS